MKRKHCQLAIGAVLIALLACGCETATRMTEYHGPDVCRMYDGPVLQSNQVSVLRDRPPVYILLLDGKSLPDASKRWYTDDFRKIELLPGLHRLRVQWFFSRTTSGRSTTSWTPDYTALEFVAEAGHSYRVEFKSVGKEVYKFGVKDITDGEAPERPRIPIEEVSTNMPPEVHNEIYRLYSLDAEDRHHAAEYLGKIGTNAAPAIPFLIDMVGDTSIIVLPKNEAQSYNYKREPFAIVANDYKEAPFAIVGHEIYVKVELGEIIANMLKKITNEDFGRDYEKWEEWWAQNKESFPAKR